MVREHGSYVLLKHTYKSNGIYPNVNLRAIPFLLLKYQKDFLRKLYSNIRYCAWRFQ